MAQPFMNAIITNGGAQLITRAQAGEIRIEFTRIAIGSGSYSEGEKEVSTLQNLKALRAEKNSYPLSSIEVHNSHSVKVMTLITNQDPATGQTLVDKGYFINEMGLFAKVKGEGADTEVLYSIAVTTGANGDFMPPFNGYYPVQIIQEYYATVDNSAEVTIQADIGGVILTEDYLELKANFYALYEAVTSTDIVEESFYGVYTQINEVAAMSSVEVMRALNTKWDGQTSRDVGALSSTEIETALSTKWDGQTSTDAEALSSTEIAEVIS